MAHAQTTFDHPRNDVLSAAPPDDGGHQGSYTRPQDMLIVPENTGEYFSGPALQYTNDSPRERTSAPLSGLAFIVAALVLGLVLAFWITW